MVEENNIKNTKDDNTTENGVSGEDLHKLEKVEKKYQIISNIVFNYGIIFLITILVVFIFFMAIKNKESQSFNNKNEGIETANLGNFRNKENKISEYDNQDLEIIIAQGSLDISENIIHSFNNLIKYKGFILPRGTFLYEPEEIKDIKYFKDQNYDIAELGKFINNTIFLDYNEIGARENEEIPLIGLTNNKIEDTFFISCANQHKIFNGVCNNYIKQFLNKFFVYKISDDYPGINKTIKNIIKRKKYKEDACDGITNFIKYSNTAPTELEEIFEICGGKYTEQFYIIQDFVEVTDELNNKYIKPNISKYTEINEYKLISYQQILYNNLENGIPPYEGSYKSYTSYLTNILNIRGEDPIDSFYYDATYRFNNLYIIPTLNKIKYQSTQSKREEIESIISSIEKLNNGNNVDGYVGLRYKITNTKLEEEIQKISGKISTETDTSIDAALTSIKSLSYLKVINDEISGNVIKINGYISLNLTNGEKLPTPFGGTLEYKNGKLIVKEFSVSLGSALQINNILGIILEQKDYSIGEVYEYIHKNIKIYESNDYSITPCTLIMERLEKLNIEGAEVLNCNGEKMNIIKGGDENKVLYQIKMENYDIKSITTSSRAIQDFIDENFSGITTNATTISNIVPNIVAYQPKKIDSSILIGNSNAIIAIDDLSNYLGVTLTDIGERSGRVAAEFKISNITFIGVYDTNTKILGPIFLRQVGEEGNEDPIIQGFSLHLTPENQNEINKFLIEPVGYLYDIDGVTILKYLPEELEAYKKRISNE